jgi:hypothetical protein
MNPVCPMAGVQGRTGPPSPPRAGRRRPAGERRPGPVVHPRAEGLQHAGAAVGAGAAADSQDDPCATGVQRRADDLSHPEARRPQGLGAPAGQQAQAAHPSQLDDRQLAAAAVGRGDRLARRPARAHGHPLESAAIGRVQGAVPPSADGHAGDGRAVARHPPQARGDVPATSAAVSEPLNLSGATSTCTGSHPFRLRFSRAARSRWARPPSSPRGPRTPRRCQGSVPIEMFVTRSRITSTTTGTRNSAISSFARSKAGAMSAGLRPGSPCSRGPPPP